MESTYNKKDFYQRSMYYGTLLGTVWSVMYILLFAGVGNFVMLLLCSALFFASPFIAGMFAKKYRREECNDNMNFTQVWIFLFYMYISAALFSALISFIYLKFIDGGAFLLSLQETLSAGAELPGTDETMKQQMTTLAESIGNTSAADFVWQILSNNMFNTSVLPLIIALFIRKNNKND